MMDLVNVNSKIYFTEVTIELQRIISKKQQKHTVTDILEQRMSFACFSRIYLRLCFVCLSTTYFTGFYWQIKYFR